MLERYKAAIFHISEVQHKDLSIFSPCSNNREATTRQLCQIIQVPINDTLLELCRNPYQLDI